MQDNDFLRQSDSSIIADEFFVSNYVGKTAFAAVNLMAPATMAVSTIGFMMEAGGSVSPSDLGG